MRKVTLKGGCVDSNELTLASNIFLPSTLQHLTLLWGKVDLPGGVSNSDLCQLKNNGIILVDRVALATRARTILPLHTNPQVIAHKVQCIIAWDNVHKVAAYVIGLLKAQEVKLLAFILCAWGRD
jgi:hypothetical protein